MPSLRKWSIIITLSVMAGIVGGLSAVLFRLLINFMSSFFFGELLPRISVHYKGHNLGYIFLPAIGGLLTAPILKRYSDIRGNGVPEVIEAVISKKGSMKTHFGPLKALTTAVAIGSGASVGREGPIASISAAFASLMGQYLKLKPEMRRLITTCGLAAGIAGTFNTPLAGAMFALEVVYMGAFSINLVPIFIAAITGDAVTLALLGNPLEIAIPANLTFSTSELSLFFILGLVLGVLSALYAKAIHEASRKVERLPLPFWFKITLGGLGVGFLGTLLPEYGIMGVGYGGMELAIAGKLALRFLIILGVAKMLATLLTISTGYSGGIFAPSLYIGAAFGAAFGEAVAPLHPTNVSTYALAGMAAFFSGATQAPLSQMIMVTELTGSYSLLPPLMVSSTTGFLAARFILKGQSIYTLKLKRKGLNVRTGRPVILETISVGEIMTVEPVSVYEWDTLFHVEHLVAETGHDCFPVLNGEGRVVGIVGVKDFLKKPSALKTLPVRRFLRKEYTVTYPSESAEDAFEKLMAHDQNLLPVVDEEGKLLGVITKRDIYKAYYRGLGDMYIE